MGAATEPPGVCAGLGGAGKGLLEAGGGVSGSPLPAPPGIPRPCPVPVPSAAPPPSPSGLPRAPAPAQLPPRRSQANLSTIRSHSGNCIPGIRSDGCADREGGGRREGGSLAAARSAPALAPFSHACPPPPPGDGGSLGTLLVSSALIPTPPSSSRQPRCPAPALKICKALRRRREAGQSLTSPLAAGE